MSAPYRISEEDCAAQLGVDVQTLIQWAAIGYGPIPNRQASVAWNARRLMMFYRQKDIDRFLPELQEHRDRVFADRFLPVG